MIRILFLFLALPLLLVTVACRPAIEIDEKLPTVTLDPSVLSGQLENGFNYYLRSANSALRNDRIELRLVVKAGSLDEAAHQRGYAHMVEHMAYRGTRSFSAERIESLLSDNGLRWGHDVNATTHYAATVYRFSLDQSDEHLLPVLLELMAQWLDDIEFEQSALEKEKRIVDAELRERYAARNYVVDPVIVSAYAGSRYDNRQPAGDIRLIYNATTDELHRFWRSHYRPDNAALIITGGDRPWRFESMIVDAFADLDPRAEPLPVGSTDDTQTTQAARGVQYSKDNMVMELLSSNDPTLDLPSLSVNLISRQRELPKDIDSSIESIKNRARSQMLFNAYSYLLRNRIERTHQCGAIELNTSLVESGQAIEKITMTVTSETMLSCLSVAFNAVHEVQSTELTTEEFEEFKMLFVQIAELTVDQYRSRDAEALASGLVDMVTNGEIVLSVWEMQTILREVVAEFDSTVLNNIIRNITETHRLVFSAVSNTAEAPTIADMISTLDNDGEGPAAGVRSVVIHGNLKSDQTQLAATTEPPERVRLNASSSHNQWSTQSIATSSLVTKVRSQGRYHEWRLANGATAILLQDNEYDQISITATGDGGCANRSGASAIAARSLPAYLSVNGVGGYTGGSLRNIKRQKEIFVDPFVEPFHHGINASGAAKELTSMILMIRSYFTEPLVIEPQSSVFLQHLKNSNAAAVNGGLYAQTQFGATDNKKQLSNALFIEAHKELFGSTEKFGFIFTGLIEPDELELKLHYLVSNNLAEKAQLSPVSERSFNNAIIRNRGDKLTRFNMVFSCGGVSGAGSTSGNLNTSSQSFKQWRLLTDMIAERLRYSLREESGFVYEIQSDVLASSELVQQLEFSVLPKDEIQVLSIISEVLSQISSNGFSEQELNSALIRDRRNRTMDTSGYESISSRKAQQWLYSGAINVEDRDVASLYELNQLAQCLNEPAQQAGLVSFSDDQASVNLTGTRAPHGQIPGAVSPYEQ